MPATTQIRTRLFRIENYIPLIAQKARSCHNRLPIHLRSWITVQDLINDGVVHAREDVMPKYDIRSPARFSTLLFIALDNFYAMKAKSLTCEKRTPIESELLTEEIPPPNIIGELAAEVALRRMFAFATDDTQEFIRHRFFEKSTLDTPKLVRKGESFRNLRKEFLRLSKAFGLTPELTRTFLDKRRREDYVVEGYDR